jgi:cbb3-type cytochrome oxidase maturation protein
MSSMLILILVSLCAGLAAWFLFLWAVKSGQFDDVERPKYRMLDDDDDGNKDQDKEKKKETNTGENTKSDARRWNIFCLLPMLGRKESPLDPAASFLYDS